MQSTVPLLGEPLPVEGGLSALGWRKLWPWSPARAVGLPAVYADKGFARSEASGLVNMTNNTDTFDRMVPTRKPDYQI